MTTELTPDSSGQVPDIAEATNQLVLAIADGSGSPALREAMLAMNRQMAAIRPYEAALIPDREAEYTALSECWAARDWPRLKGLIAAYFARREALAPQLARLINHPN
jgi:hypothetical protein